MRYGKVFFRYTLQSFEAFAAKHFQMFSIRCDLDGSKIWLYTSA